MALTLARGNEKKFILRPVNSTTPNPSLFKEGSILAVQVVRTPLLTKEGLGVVVRVKTI